MRNRTDTERSASPFPAGTGKGGTHRVARRAALLTAALLSVLLLTSCLGSGTRREDTPYHPEELDAAELSGILPGAASEQPEEVGEPEKPEESGEPEEMGKPGETGEAAASAGTTKAEAVLAEMNTWEKVCQLFVVFPTSVTGTDTATIAGEATRAGLSRYPVGGFLYDRGNMRSREQLLAMLTGTREMSKIPPILTCDEEGGRVNRLMGAVGTPYVGPMLSYRSGGKAAAEENAAVIAEGLVSCGFNMDLAPVADVWTNPKNTVIGNRAYSRDCTEAAELVSAAVEGFHRGGVACTLKHFPGHGDTAEDSHFGSAYVHKTLEELRAGEFLPFAAGIAAGADAVMIGHLIVEDVDRTPAPFSYPVVTGLLREELGFDGVVMTDSLEMKAVAEHSAGGEYAVRAIQAGVDLLLCPADFPAAAECLYTAVEQGELSQARLDESVLRVLRLKENRGIL